MGEDEGRVLGSANDVSTSFDARAMSDSLFRALDGTFGADACDARERQCDGLPAGGIASPREAQIPHTAQRARADDKRCDFRICSNVRNRGIG